MKETNIEKKLDGISRLDALFDNVTTYKECSKFQELMDRCVAIRNYAPYNVMLMGIQMPGARCVLRANEWEKKFNRKPKLDARPLLILFPFGPVEFVYEISDTEDIDPKHGYGDDHIIANVQKNQKYTWDLLALDMICENLKFDGISVQEFRSATGFSAKIEVNFKKEGLDVYVHKKYETLKIAANQHFTISINDKADPEEAISFICHELGHLFCHHINTKTYSNSNKPLWNKSRLLSHEEEEFEAESVAWLVCQRLGIKSNSVSYLNSYYKNHNSIPKISVDTVLNAAAEVEKRIKDSLQYNKGLLYKYDDNFKEAIKNIK